MTPVSIMLKGTSGRSKYVISYTNLHQYGTSDFGLNLPPEQTHQFWLNSVHWVFRYTFVVPHVGWAQNALINLFLMMERSCVPRFMMIGQTIKELWPIFS